MNRQTVKSNFISEIGYDESTSTLEVAFKTGDIWQYLNVPQEVYERLMDSESKGKVFLSEIKLNYKSIKVNN